MKDQLLRHRLTHRQGPSFVGAVSLRLQQGYNTSLNYNNNTRELYEAHIPIELQLEDQRGRVFLWGNKVSLGGVESNPSSPSAPRETARSASTASRVFPRRIFLLLPWILRAYEVFVLRRVPNPRKVTTTSFISAVVATPSSVSHLHDGSASLSFAPDGRGWRQRARPAWC